MTKELFIPINIFRQFADLRYAKRAEVIKILLKRMIEEAGMFDTIHDTMSPFVEAEKGFQITQFDSARQEGIIICKLSDVLHCDIDIKIFTKEQ